MPPDPLLFTLRALECELQDPDARGGRVRIEHLLHAQFFEIGRSGAVYTRPQVIDQLAADQNRAKVHTQSFAVFELAPTVALLTYQSADDTPSGSLERHANRSSIWRLAASGWQMVFHQGTSRSPFVPNAA
jgi:hypothetical protein